jgi:hypothetical protein
VKHPSGGDGSRALGSAASGIVRLFSDRVGPVSEIRSDGSKIKASISAYYP